MWNGKLNNSSACISYLVRNTMDAPYVWLGFTYQELLEPNECTGYSHEWNRECNMNSSGIYIVQRILPSIVPQIWSLRVESVALPVKEKKMVKLKSPNWVLAVAHSHPNSHRAIAWPHLLFDEEKSVKSEAPTCRKILMAGNDPALGFIYMVILPLLCI